MRFLFLAALVVILSACSRMEETTLANLRQLASQEFQWLKNEPSGKTGVILEERRTMKFVQFGGRSLSVDLPHQTLSREEMERAERVMTRFGVKKEVYPLGEGSGRYTQTAFQKDLNGDEAEAFRIAEAVFREIYLLPSDAKITAIRVE
jgi:hypothetical protein